MAKKAPFYNGLTAGTKPHAVLYAVAVVTTKELRCPFVAVLTVALLVSLSSASATFGISAEWTIDGSSSILFSALLFAQTAAGPNHAAQARAASTNTAASKLTTNQQRGRRLLEAALAEASSLQPEMRTFVMWKIAEAYKKADSAKSEALLRDAFVASLSIEDIAPETPAGVCQDLVGCGIKVWLQREILKSMISSSDVEALFLQARPQVQKSAIELLIQRYLAQKNLAKVRQLMTSLADQGEYPYESAMDLIFALPAGSAERVTIFSEAVSAYRAQSAGISFGTDYMGLPGMVTRFWRDMPPEMAEDAIDEILVRARNPDEGSFSHFTFSGPAGSIALNSQYQYRLFQLLPILEQLDQSKAESLLRDNPDLRPMLNQFPEGLQAVQPDYRLHPPKSGEPAQISMNFSVGNDRATVSPLAVQAQQELQRRQKQIATDTDGSPRQAIAEAVSLPEFMSSPGTFGGQDTYPRAQALLEIARKTGRKNSSVARDALGELRKALAQASPMMQGAFLNDAVSEYMEIGDQESAETSLKEALKVAEKLYAVDTDSDNPNRAFKGAWPSTNQWRHCIQLGTKLSPTKAEAMIAGIRDPDIATFQKVYFASALLGVTSGAASVAVITKDREGFMSF
jgi:hypothetical protein